jgi:MYXO-CTERM domain-containing protein
LVDVLPPPVTDSGGSSAVDVEILALLAAGGAWRRRVRCRRSTTA